MVSFLKYDSKLSATSNVKVPKAKIWNSINIENFNFSFNLEHLVKYSNNICWWLNVLYNLFDVLVLEIIIRYLNLEQRFYSRY